MAGEEHVHHSVCQDVEETVFRVEPSGPGTFSLVSAAAGTALEPRGELLVLNQKHDSPDQIWRSTSSREGSIELVHVASDRRLAVNRTYDGLVRLERKGAKDVMRWVLRPADAGPRVRLNAGASLSSAGEYLVSEQKTYFAAAEGAELVVRKGSGPMERGPIVYSSKGSAPAPKRADPRGSTHLWLDPSGSLKLFEGAVPGLEAPPIQLWTSPPPQYAGRFELVLESTGRLAVQDAADGRPVWRSPPPNGRLMRLRLDAVVTCAPSDGSAVCTVGSLHEAKEQGRSFLGADARGRPSLANDAAPLWIDAVTRQDGGAASFRMFLPDGRAIVVGAAGVGQVGRDEDATRFTIQSSGRDMMLSADVGGVTKPCGALRARATGSGASTPALRGAALARANDDASALVCDVGLDFAAGTSVIAGLEVDGVRCLEPVSCFFPTPPTSRRASR